MKLHYIIYDHICDGLSKDNSLVQSMETLSFMDGTIFKSYMFHVAIIAYIFILGKHHKETVKHMHLVVVNGTLLTSAECK